MNRIIQTFIILAIILVAVWLWGYFLEIFSMDFLQSWGKYISIVWGIVFISILLIRGIFQNNSLKQVIEWKSEYGSAETIFWRWNGNLRDEIKNKSKIIIAPEQWAIIVNEGKIEDTIEKEWVYDITSKNIPFITNLIKIMQENESEHKVYIYFFKKTEIANLAWGTAQPIIYEDPKYKFPLRFWLFGNYSVQINNTVLFFENYIQSQTSFQKQDLEELLLSRTLSILASEVPEMNFSYLELDKNRTSVREHIFSKLLNEFENLGIVLKDFRIDGLSFDTETKKYIDEVAMTSAKKQAASDAGMSYVDKEKIEAMRDAAANEWWAAGMVAGFGVGNTLVNAMESNKTSSDSSLEEKLTQLSNLKKEWLISEDDYNKKKQELLAAFV